MIDEKVIFQNMVSNHLEKLLATSPKYVKFVERFFNGQMLASLSELALPKINLTLADRKEHSTQIALPPVCYDISTLAIPMEAASKYYEMQYGGFGKLCSRFMAEHPAFTVQGCEILIVIVYGRYDTKCWANLAILAPRTSGWPDATVIPTDLLTEAERRQTIL